MRRVLALTLAVGAVACGGESKPPALALPEGCQPLLAGADCLLPYPSDFFLVDDASMPSGKRVAITGAARPIVRETRVSADPNDLRAIDGFSPLSTIVALLGSAASLEGLVPLKSAPGDTATAASRTLILDVASGAVVPHFVDLDDRAPDPARRAIVLHPLAPLAEKTRYVVALRGVRGADGALAATPEGFRRVRDGIDPAPGGFDAIAAIERLGVPREELQLAWSFTTGSRARITSDMLAVRRLTLEWLATHTPTVSITSVAERAQPQAWRTIEGEIEVPLFVDKDEPGARLARNAAGEVEQRGTGRVQFSMMVPRAVESAGAPGKLLAFGHGFFGGRTEVTEPQTREIAQRTGAVTFGIDWQGMSRGDVFLVVEGLVSKPHDALTFVERTHQAMASWIVATRALAGSMKQLRPLQFADGRPVYDDSTLAFLGISQGHILGGVLAAVHPDLERITLQAGGAGFSLLMSRARPFEPFLTYLDESLPDALDQQKFVALSQTQLDRIDPGIYAQHVLAEPLEGSKPKKVLLQIGLGDVQVPNLGSWLHARALGIPLLTPAPAPVPLLPEVTGPVDGSALALFDFGIDLAVYDRAASPELGNRVHDRLRLTVPAIAQLDTFIEQGVIVHPCDGPCRVD